ncbi:serine/threonine-protein kinase [Pseudonocardia spinosispora]|uniref:serine/threonine-protein kinase n=1 Tax=Pseudonocardia spinosispora TaxID=103441 RepID=UPI0004117D93|nr:serine/threonine-protein kinase [Pseudonocardia spinosispora]
MTLTGDASPLVLAQRYRVGERIGAGSMGAVWQATDELLGRTVAVKQLLLQPGVPGFDDRGYQEAKQRILREGRLAARLQHAHTIAVFDVVLHEDSPWLVMEYMPSRTFGALLDEEGPIDPRRAASIGSQIADGLAAAHGAGIVHRDIKPGNVLIGPDGNVKITDFGVSRAADDVQITRTGMIAGTPAFLAPEIARGRTPTSASDVFALGSTLYAAVEGTPPFGLDENAYALLYTVGEGKVKPPDKAGELTEPLMRMLSKDPADRPSAATVRDELAALAAGRTIGTPGTMPSGLPLPLVSRPAAQTEPSSTPAHSATKVDTSPLPIQRPRAAQQVSAAPPAMPSGAAAARPGRRQRPSTVGIVLLIVVLVIAGGIALLAYGIGSSGGSSDEASSRPGVSVAPTTPGAEAVTTTDPATFIKAYYQLAPANPTEAWKLLSPQAQAQSKSFADYQSFYTSLKTVTVVEPPTVTGTNVRARLRFDKKDLSWSRELYDFVLARNPDGTFTMTSFQRIA